MPLTRARKSALVCLLIFVVVSMLVVTGATSALDDRTLQVIAGWRTPAITRFMRGISWLGNWQGEVPLLLLVAGILFVRRRSGAAWRYLAFALSGEVMWALAKLLFHRPRPTIVSHLGDAGWYSYPSGHATLAPVIWGIGLALLAGLIRPGGAKILLWSVGIAMPLVIGGSRLYLGVHYPTDVVAGLALGLGWAFVWHVPIPTAESITRTT